MPERGGLIASGILHLAVLLMILFGLPNLFRKPLPEETPMVVQLVKFAPQTHATKTTQTPPTPRAKPEVAEDITPPPPKPEPPKPEPPKAEVPPPPPPPPAKPPEPIPPPPEPKPEPPPPPKPPKPEPPPPKPPEPKPPEPKPEPKPEPPPPPPEPPKPVEPPKPEPPKPTPPKPPPPKPVPPKPKPDDSQFDSLLKNLAKNDPARKPDKPEKPQKTPPQPRQASSQPIAPLGAELTASEIDLVKQQIEACWNIPAGAREAQDLTPEFRVYMNQDGTVRSAELLNSDRLGDPFFQAAADSARRALRNPSCQPLKLPAGKYNEWQTFTITFDPKDLT